MRCAAYSGWAMNRLSNFGHVEGRAGAIAKDAPFAVGIGRRLFRDPTAYGAQERLAPRQEFFAFPIFWGILLSAKHLVEYTVGS